MKILSIKPVIVEIIDEINSRMYLPKEQSEDEIQKSSEKVAENVTCKIQAKRPGMVTHTCNPRTLGG